MVTAHELLTACSDTEARPRKRHPDPGSVLCDVARKCEGFLQRARSKCEGVRTALQWTFPDTCLEDVFAELDANKDGMVTMHEFQTRVKGFPTTTNSRCTSRQCSTVSCE
ncbi:unnamed protein product [Effrenium voratum]|nr:unnamed protein product [Effrenium voratum]